MKDPRIEKIRHAMKASIIYPGISGLWKVEKQIVNETTRPKMLAWAKVTNEKRPTPPFGTYTILHRKTIDTMDSRYGEVVMNDYPNEINTHLEFALKAKGRVLIVGLGLGCVVRGCLVNSQVDHIDVIERDEDVIELCRCGVEDPRVTIHKMDALEELPAGHWNYSWVDVWSDPDKQEPSLRSIHLKIMANLLMGERTDRIGCWQSLPFYKRTIPKWI